MSAGVAAQLRCQLYHITMSAKGRRSPDAGRGHSMRKTLSVPTFRNSRSISARIFCELRKVTGTRKLIDSSTAYRSEVPERTRRLWCRDFRSAVLALLVAAFVSTAMAQDKTFELKLSHWVPASHPLQKALEDWGAAVEKASGGTIKYKVFPAQQLGKAFDHYDMARDGIADIAYVSPGYQPGRFPIFAAANLPFMLANAKGGTEALDDWYRKYAATEMKDVKF